MRVQLELDQARDVLHRVRSEREEKAQALERAIDSLRYRRKSNSHMMPVYGRTASRADTMLSTPESSLAGDDEGGIQHHAFITERRLSVGPSSNTAAAATVRLGVGNSLGGATHLICLVLSHLIIWSDLICLVSSHLFSSLLISSLPSNSNRPLRLTHEAREDLSYHRAGSLPSLNVARLGCASCRRGRRVRPIRWLRHLRIGMERRARFDHREKEIFDRASHSRNKDSVLGAVLALAVRATWSKPMLGRDLDQGLERGRVRRHLVCTPPSLALQRHRAGNVMAWIIPLVNLMKGLDPDAASLGGWEEERDSDSLGVGVGR